MSFQAASICYVDLIVKESDNNVKLIVLDRLIELRENPSHERVLQVGSHPCSIAVSSTLLLTRTSLWTSFAFCLRPISK